MLRHKPPRITGRAVIIPEMILKTLRGETQSMASDARLRRQIECTAMNAVLKIEKKLGFAPKDVSARRGIGYDIESLVPPALMSKYGVLRIIEVKGRQKGATDVTVTHNEILTGCNRPMEFILALVEVDGEQTHTRYLKRPFKHEPAASTEAMTFNIELLVKESELVYDDLEHGNVAFCVI